MVVDVGDTDIGQLRREQAGLGAEVVLHRAVQVEVIAPEVGEHGRANHVPSTRYTARACDETSITTACLPASRLRRAVPAARAPPAWCGRPRTCR